MGMDIVGIKNKDAYFRNNVWWWRPLANYCIDLAPDLIKNPEGWHFNDGAGLDEQSTLELARRLTTEISNGRTAAFERCYAEKLAALPSEVCKFCDGTGIRADLPGGPRLCNACGGEKKLRPSATNYPFSEKNVLEWVEFLMKCGGFKIY